MKNASDKRVKIRVEDLCFSYKSREVLKDIRVSVLEATITALIGASGVGKSTFLMTLNRLWESLPGAKMTGCVQIRFDGVMRDIYAPSFNVSKLRRLVGMVFQTPNPLPMSI